MKIYNTIPGPEAFQTPVLTIGTFDGVHKGHKKILTKLIQAAERKHGESIVLTFPQHPREVLNPDQLYETITTIEEKLAVFKETGINHVILLDFNESIAHMSAVHFFNNIIVDGIGVRELVVGYDHAFGKNRGGDIDSLRKLARAENIIVSRVEEELLNNRPISSTWLREEIKTGNMQCVHDLLGRPYEFTGTVIPGHGRGRDLGYPTANLLPKLKQKSVPADGVYAVTLLLMGKKYKGVLNIGTNPTFQDENRSIEVYILNFNETIYEKELTIFFHHRLRGEIAFPTTDDLIRQMDEDVRHSLDLLKNEPL